MHTGFLIEEWGRHEYILLALPNEDTDWNYIIEEAKDQYVRLINAFTSKNIKVLLLCRSRSDFDSLKGIEKKDLVTVLETPFNDTWTRDYGFLSLKGGLKAPMACDFGFNGWGLKFAADKDNLVNINLKDKGIIDEKSYVNNRDFILEGGSVESDGKGLILTTSLCLCSPNRNGGLGKNQVERQLKEKLGARKVLFLDHGALIGDDTDSHIDTLARLMPGNKIVYVGCNDPEDLQYTDLKKMKEELQSMTNLSDEPFELIELPLPPAIYDEEGNRLPATYANFLIFDRYIFLPVYNVEESDSFSLNVLEKSFGQYEIVPVDCTTLIKQHGSLHCATMQIPQGILNLGN